MRQVDPVCTGPGTDLAAVTSDMTVVDVRPPAEHEAGHLPGAVSISLAELPWRAGTGVDVDAIA